mgnify:CR=1 FL=1
MNILVHIDSKMGGQPALRFLRDGLGAFAKNQADRQLFLSASKPLTDQAEWMAAGFQILRVTKPAFPLFSGQIFRSRLSRQVRKLKIDCCLIINGSSLNCPGTTQFLVPLNIAWKPSPHDIGNAHIRLLALAPPQSMETSSFSPERTPSASPSAASACCTGVSSEAPRPECPRFLPPSRERRRGSRQLLCLNLPEAASLFAGIVNGDEDRLLGTEHPRDLHRVGVTVAVAGVLVAHGHALTQVRLLAGERPSPRPVVLSPLRATSPRRRAGR